MTDAVVTTGAPSYDVGRAAPLSMDQSGRLRVLSEAAPGAPGGTLPDGTDRSGTITTGGTAQTLAPANASRTSLTGQNTSDDDLWINETGGTAAANAAGSYRVVSGAAFEISTRRAISIVGATTGQRWAATEK